MLTTQREIVLSLPREQAELETSSEKDKLTTFKTPIPAGPDGATRHVVEKFQNGAVRSDDSIVDNVGQHRHQDDASN
jgi:hypothetical protein